MIWPSDKLEPTHNFTNNTKNKSRSERKESHDFAAVANAVCICRYMFKAAYAYTKLHNNDNKPSK